MESLYEDTKFGKWLATMPDHVECNYNEGAVDMEGTRVEVIFYIEDEE